MAEIDGGEADREGQGRHDFEIDETLDAHATYALEVAMAGDSGDQRRQNQGGDDGLDEAQKYVAEDTQVDRDTRCVEAQFGAGDHRDKDPRCKGPATQAVYR